MTQEKQGGDAGVCGDGGAAAQSGGVSEHTDGPVGVGALKEAAAVTPQAEIDRVVHPPKGDWPNYNGALEGNRNSALDQIDQQNVAKLQRSGSM